MKKLFTILFLAMLLAVPGMAKSQFPFLEALGIDAKSVTTSGAVTVSTPSPAENRVNLTLQQAEKLLGDVDDMRLAFGGIAIHMVRALPEGHTLIVYRVAFGNGEFTFFATYDKAGAVIDYLYTGNWSTQETSHGYTTYDMAWAEFKNDDDFVLHRTISKVKPSEVGNGKVLWSMKRDYCYFSDANGFITFQKVDVPQPNGKNCTKDDILSYDFDDFLVFMPHSAKNLVSALNQLCIDKNVTMAQLSKFSDTANLLFRHNEMEMLDFMYQHPKSPVVAMMKAAVKNGQLGKSDLYNAINKLPAGKQRNALKKLTSQWTVKGAVG